MRRRPGGRKAELVETRDCTRRPATLFLLGVDGFSRGVGDEFDGVAVGVFDIDPFGAVAVFVYGGSGGGGGFVELVFGDAEGDVRGVLPGCDEGDFVAADLEEGPGFVLVKDGGAE